MTAKQKIALAVMAGVAIGMFGVSWDIAKEYNTTYAKYVSTYEMAAYLAGRAEAAGLDLDEFDMLALKAMKPEAKLWSKKKA